MGVFFKVTMSQLFLQFFHGFRDAKIMNFHCKDFGGSGTVDREGEAGSGVRVQSDSGEGGPVCRNRVISSRESTGLSIIP